jgi:hypothetical protein
MLVLGLLQTLVSLHFSTLLLLLAAVLIMALLSHAEVFRASFSLPVLLQHLWFQH